MDKWEGEAFRMGGEVLYLSTWDGAGLAWRGRVDFGDGLRDVYKLGEGRTQ